jgi:uncharacterized membrane protein SpoIIM required for sporulation
MDYARFVRLRRPVWEAFERQLAASSRRPSHADLEETALRYRQVLHDHALAAARYPGTAAAQRLRALAVQGTHRLIRDGREIRGISKGRGLVRFFTRTFPALFRLHLPLMGVATALFLLAILWGLAITALQPSLGTAILGPAAVAGLEEGRLWTESLVTTTPPSVSSSGIATNNVSVALTAWIGGLLAGLGPLYVLVSNGLLLGSVLGLTLHYSMGGELLEFISAHGFLELTLILVASAAGLALGRAMVTAGDRPRSLALRDAGRDSLRLLLGCLPWFVLLAVVEVFVSPRPELPVSLKLVLGLSLETAFLALALYPHGSSSRDAQ